MIGIGGKTDKSNIEVHDIQFLIGDTIESCHESLRNNWYGNEKSLHMDSYVSVKGVQGYEIKVDEKENTSDLNLFLVTFGGYTPDVFEELHCYELVVASRDKEARSIAMKLVSHKLKNIHVDNIVKIDKDLTGSTYDLHFTASNEAFSLLPEWQGYTKLSK